MVAITALFIIGCATPYVLNTPSGKPEVTIAGNVAEQVASLMINGMIDIGMQVKSQSSSMIVFEQDSTDIMLNAMIGAPGGINKIRMTVNLIQYGGNTRVVCSIAHVSYDNYTGAESVRTLNHNQNIKSVQQGLLSLKKKLESSP